MGKSALTLCMAANLAVRKQVPVALFTLEMSKSEVTQRLMCSEAKVESQRLRSGKLAADDWPRLTAACDKLAKAPIYVDDTGSMTIMGIRAKARRLKSKEPNLGLIIVDYLQLMSSDSNYENRVQEVSQISRQLKILARELDLPIIAMSQLSRAVEQRHDKRPILSDLRESGSFEQDADLVAFIYRDEYYNDERQDQGLAEVILAKHRNGPTGHVKLSFLQALREVRRPGGGLALLGRGLRAGPRHRVARRAQHDRDRDRKQPEDGDARREDRQRRREHVEAGARRRNLGGTRVSPPASRPAAGDRACGRPPPRGARRGSRCQEVQPVGDHRRALGLRVVDRLRHQPRREGQEGDRHQQQQVRRMTRASA